MMQLARHWRHCRLAGRSIPTNNNVGSAAFVGMEMVEQLVNSGINVTLVEMMPQILVSMDVERAAILQRDLEEHGVEVITGDAIQEFSEYYKDPDASILTLKSGCVLPPAHLTILGMGVRPDTGVIKDSGIEVTPGGHIVQTTVYNVWAVGDAIEVNNPLIPGGKWAVPLAGPANRQ
jgi:NAD(P)H-nitrite reductase large subunit